MLKVKQKYEKTLREWYYSRKKIDMNPTYQRRGGLWDKNKKSLLINSVLNEYDIPKIYLADFTEGSTPLNEKNKQFAVIDGKQRLETFFQFFEGDIKLGDKPVYVNGEKVVLEGLSYRNLHERNTNIALRFDEFIPTVMSVVTDSHEEVKDLFIRLNQNVPMRGPEKRNAMPGPIPSIIREIATHKFFRVNIKFSVQRGQDLDQAAKMLLFEDKNGFSDTKKDDLDNFVKKYTDKKEDDFNNMVDKVITNLDNMSDIFDERDIVLKTQAEIPLYYWLVKNHVTNGDIDDKKSFLTFARHFRKLRLDINKLQNRRAEGEDVEIPEESRGFIKYNSDIRSPDDRRTQSRMYDVMEENLLHFLSGSWIEWNAVHPDEGIPV
jgi:hypothetical protein